VGHSTSSDQKETKGPAKLRRVADSSLDLAWVGDGPTGL